MTADGDDDGENGIIGLPVLLALETMRRNSDGTVEFGFPSSGRNLTAANLALVSGEPIAQISIGARTENAVLDTGAYSSVLLPEFDTAFPTLMKAPLEVAKREIGNRAEDPNVTTIAPLSVGVGGLGTVLQPARVLSREPVDDSHGVLAWLGMDLLGQASSVTIDFTAMMLTLHGIDEAGTNDAGHVCAAAGVSVRAGMELHGESGGGRAMLYRPDAGGGLAGQRSNGGRGRREALCTAPERGLRSGATLQGKAGRRGDLQSGNRARAGPAEAKLRSG